MNKLQHNAPSVTPCTGNEAPKASTLSPSVVMYWDGGERAITAREKAVIEEHRNSCFSIPLVVVPEGWALVPLQSDEDMRSAGGAYIAYATHDNRDRLAAEVWTAMCREAAHVAQPVAAPPYNAGGIELTACQLHEALMMAGSPELALPFEDRSQVRIFRNENGHSGPGLYCECVDVEEEGCILLDGTHAPVARVIEDASMARRPVDLLDQQDAIRINAEGVNVIPPAAFRADNAHAVGVYFVNCEVHRNPDLAEVAPVNASGVRLDDDETVTTCEAGQPEWGPGARYESESVTFCRKCFDTLLSDERPAGALANE